MQSYEIYPITSQEKKDLLAAAALNQDSISQAAVVLVFTANPQRSLKYGERGKLYALQDATIACTYAQLAAANLGLGSVWVGAFDEKEVARIINAGPSERPIAILPVGYPAEKPRPTPRRSLDDIVHKEEKG